MDFQLSYDQLWYDPVLCALHWEYAVEFELAPLGWRCPHRRPTLVGQMCNLCDCCFANCPCITSADLET